MNEDESSKMEQMEEERLHLLENQGKRGNKEPHLGGSFLKADGTLRKPAVCEVDSRAGNVPNHPGGPRLKRGDFGVNVEVPVTLDGMEFVVSFPWEKGDALKLRKAFGDNLTKWVGRHIRVSEGETVRRIRVEVA